MRKTTGNKKRRQWSPRPFPSALAERVIAGGAEFWFDNAQYELADRPQALANLRRRRVDYCLALYRTWRRAGRERRKRCAISAPIRWNVETPSEVAVA